MAIRTPLGKSFVGNARYNVSFDRTGENSDDRNSGGRRFEIEGEVVGKGNDHIRIATHDVTSQLWIARGSSFAGISLNQKTLPLDISQATEFVENPSKRSPLASVIFSTGNDESYPAVESFAEN